MSLLISTTTRTTSRRGIHARATQGRAVFQGAVRAAVRGVQATQCAQVALDALWERAGVTAMGAHIDAIQATVETSNPCVVAMIRADIDAMWPANPMRDMHMESFAGFNVTPRA